MKVKRNLDPERCAQIETLTGAIEHCDGGCFFRTIGKYSMV
jgi:hypothetical protein